MRNTLLLLSCTLLLACGVADDRVRIEGSFSKISRAELYVYSEDGAFDGVDTIRIEDGSFVYERPLAQPAVLTLMFPNLSEIPLVAEPGKVVRVDGDAGQLMATEISGTEENEALTRFRLQNRERPQAEVRMAAHQYIRDHAGTLGALALFRQYFVKAERPDAAVALSLLDAMRQAQPRSTALQRLDARVRPLLRNAPGQALADFSAVTLQGDTVSRRGYLGRPLLVVFFASWNNEGRGMLTAVRRLRRAYGGRLGLLLVSLDVEEAACRRYMESDSLQAVPAVFDSRAFAAPLAQRLGVHYVPGNLLVDAKGGIVARDLDEAALQSRVAALLK